MDTTFLLHNILESLGKQSMTEFKCGDFLGPYALKDDENSIKVTLTNFTGEPMSLEIEANPVVRRIQCPTSPLLANCAVLQTGAFIQILFTKDVQKNEALRAILVADMNYRLEQKAREKEKEKNQHECSKCHVAGKKLETEKPEKSNLILLPLAFHDMPQHNAVQVMGPIHSIVPVAVGRKSTNFLNTNPIFVNNSSKLQVPTSLSISAEPSEPQLPVNIKIQIPIIDLDEEKIPPLDLSRTSLSPSCSPASKSSGSEPFSPEKPFSCSCGVSFSSQNTFDAHKQFYCMHTQSSSSGGANGRNDGLRKVPEKCTKCDFVPVSASQLAIHIRTAHQTTKTFTCLVCGYRAFSMRGVRTHMRSHPNDDANKFKVNDPMDDK